MNDITKQISKNRSFIMGIACLWIMLLHCHLKINLYPILALSRFGFTQVDIFMFLSGFGLYFSLEKSNDCWKFYQKRFSRILPAYLSFAAVYIIYEVCRGEINLYDALGVITMTSFWQSGSHVFSWFGQAIAMFYLFAPILFLLVLTAKDNKKRTGILIFTSLCISFMFMRSGLILAISRIPGFLTGMIFAAHGKDNFQNSKTLKKTAIICALISVVLIAGIDMFLGDFVEKYIGTFYLIFMPLFLLPAGECFLLSDLADYLRKFKISAVFVRLTEKLGPFTFEVYLAQTLLNIMLGGMLSSIKAGILNNAVRVMIAVISVLIAVAVNKFIVSPVSNKIRA